MPEMNAIDAWQTLTKKSDRPYINVFKERKDFTETNEKVYSLDWWKRDLFPIFEKIDSLKFTIDPQADSRIRQSAIALYALGKPLDEIVKELAFKYVDIDYRGIAMPWKTWLGGQKNKSVESEEYLLLKLAEFFDGKYRSSLITDFHWFDRS